MIAYYDDNKIQLASPVDHVMTEDVGARYEAYGWHVLDVGEDLSPDNLERATREAMEVDRPAVADHRPDAHRLRRAEQAGHDQGAWLAAR